MFIDFGSGYDPYKNFLKCDVNYGCDFYSIKEIPDNSCKLIRCRNVLHHVKNLRSIFKEFNRILVKGGKVVIIDCNKENFKINYFLDNLYYKGIANNKNMWYTEKYREITKYINRNNFNIEKNYKIKEKVWIVLKKN
jgi:ubiquinone/menaquinone biosynthesis C-methylase UbiE